MTVLRNLSQFHRLTDSFPSDLTTQLRMTCFPTRTETSPLLAAASMYGRGGLGGGRRRRPPGDEPEEPEEEEEEEGGAKVTAWRLRS